MHREVVGGIPQPPYKVLIINSNKELEKHSKCEGEDKYPAIDFSKHTLLFVRGSGTFLPLELAFDVTTFKKVSARKYILSVKVWSNTWRTSFIVPKLSNNAIIELEIHQITF